MTIQQELDESRVQMLRRTYERIRAIELGGGTVTAAVLSCSDDPHPRALEGRVPIARALLATLLRTGEGWLDLVARSSAPDRTKQSLLALAGTLTESLVDRSTSISVRFLGSVSDDPTERPKLVAVYRRVSTNDDPAP